MDKTTFPSLKDRAFEVFYKELLLKATGHPTIVDFFRDGFGTMEKTLKYERHDYFLFILSHHYMMMISFSGKGV